MTDDIKELLQKVIAYQHAFEEAMSDDMDEIIVFTNKIMDMFVENELQLHIAVGAMLQCILNACVEFSEHNEGTSSKVYAQTFAMMLVDMMETNKKYAVGIKQ